MTHETAFEVATSAIRFGRGVTDEVGMDLVDLGVRRVMVLTDPWLASLPVTATVLNSLERSRMDYRLFPKVRIEPTDESFREAIRFASEGEFEGFVAVG